MPGLMDPLFKAEMQKTNGSVFPVLEVDWPDGTARYASIRGTVNSDSRGPYDGRVISFGKNSRQLSDKSKGLQSYETTVQLADKDFAILNRIGKAQRLDLVAARKYWGSANPNIPFSKWFPTYAGVLGKWTVNSPLMVTLDLTPNYYPLRKKFPYVLIDTFTWPNADKTAVNHFAPLVYGMCDDSGYLDGGAMQPHYVDTVGFQYMVSAGYTTPLRLYKAGAIQPAANWSINRVTKNGILYTLVKYPSGAGTSQITVDVAGYETVGDGTGTLIMSPLDAIQHMLVNFIYNKFGTSGTTKWIVGLGGAPINSAKLAACKTALSGRAGGSAYACSRIVTTLRTGEQELNDWALSMDVHVYWDNLGNLCFGLDNPNSIGTGLDTLIHGKDYLKPIALVGGADNVISGALAGKSQFHSQAQTSLPQAALRGMKRDIENDPLMYDSIEADDPLSASANFDTVQYTWHPATTP